MDTHSSSDNTVSTRSVPEISPMELVRTLEEGDRVQIVDIRAASGGGGMKAGFLPEEKILNIVGSKLLRIENPAEAGIDPAIPVVVICAHGNDSKIGTMHLNRIGAKARSLSGGMAAWMNVSVPRILRTPASLDRLVQFDRVGKEALSYLLISRGEALIIDPPRRLRRASAIYRYVRRTTDRRCRYARSCGLHQRCSVDRTRKRDPILSSPR